MLFQIASIITGEVTLIATKRFLSGMYNQMTFQIASCFERVITLIAIERPFFAVHISAGTLQSNNRRLIGCLISFTRSAGFNRSQYIQSN